MTTVRCSNASRPSLLGLLAAAMLGLSAVATPAAAQILVVFAAASLKNALDDVNAQFQRTTGAATKTSYAASSALARQMESGAPADLFISADQDWMDYVAGKSLIKANTRTDLLGNALVLIAPAGSPVVITIGRGVRFAEALGPSGRLAMGEPGSVPAGKYAKAALEMLDAWSSVQARIAGTENVRAALLLVARGEAPLGIVYRTDAAAEPGVKIVDTFPADTHPPIVYPVAITTASTNPRATAYLAYLKSAEARPAFARHGFAVLD